MDRVISFISIIIGVLNILIGYIYLALPSEFFVNLFGSEKFPDFPFIYFFLILSLFSLILGVIGVIKRMKTPFAIVGIIFSAIALLLWLFIWFWIVGWSTM